MGAPLRRVIVNTDAKNEADDQFAIVHALLSPSLDVVGVIPAHFGTRRTNDSMAESRQEVIHLLKLMDLDVHYADLLTLCPQWDDIFVKRALEFATSSPAPRILDCGANVGLASLFFRRAYPTARITAFEADPALFAVLETNLRANGASGVSARHAAVWTSSGTLTFQCEGADSGMIGSLPGAVDGSPAVVPSLRLRDVLEEESVDLLKLDIEGAEALVLEDCEPALHRVKALVMDLHEFDASDIGAPDGNLAGRSGGFGFWLASAADVARRYFIFSIRNSTKGEPGVSTSSCIRTANIFAI